MQENLKPNNCYINFECIEPKKCVHYKKMKREPKPCKSCNVVDQCDIHFAVEYCPTWIEWNNNKSLCRHNQGRYGECYNTIAHVQAITKYLKSIGIKSRIDGGCKDCANLNNPAKDVYCDCCLRQERKKDGYVTRAPFDLKENNKSNENFFGLKNLAANQKPLEPEFAKVVSENFFDLVGGKMTELENLYFFRIVGSEKKLIGSYSEIYKEFTVLCEPDNFYVKEKNVAWKEKLDCKIHISKLTQ